MNLKNKASKD